MSSPPLLEVSMLSTGYGKVQVLYETAVEVGEGEVVTLIGANGAGKTTLLRTIAGLLPAWRGEVLFEGAPITDLDSHRRVKRGMAMGPGGRMLFASMSVDVNLRLGAY